MTPQAALFDPLAAAYDARPNPLLRLEERVLPTLLPSIAGADILDAGCGTGRWLTLLEPLGPRSLTGADPSAAMLAIARQKTSPRTTLHQAEAAALPGADASMDLILASFVLSYVGDLAAFAAECARLLRPGGRVLLSDMHPATALARGWTRSFETGGTKVHLTPDTRPLADIVATFKRHNLHLSRLLEPPFAAPERSLFERSGKLAEFEDLASIPAIYLLAFTKAKTAPHRTSTSATTRRLTITNASWSTGPRTWSKEPLSPAGDADALDLSGYVLLPGLINAHDHLDFALFPNLGRPQPYRNAAEWAHDIQRNHAATIRLHKQVPLTTRIAFGALRNLLSGVTTVCHHNPAPSQPLPIRLAEAFGWAHSLAFAPDLVARFKATPAADPFILHAAEGIDASSRDELQTLDRLHLLTPRTVLIHALALEPAEIELLNDRGTAIVLCPTSNLFLFAQTLPTTHISALRHVALGSDSPLTARGDLLDEIFYLRTHHDLAPESLYDLVTRNAARILHLPQSQGQILPGVENDLLVTRDRHLSPAETLATLTLADIELVLLADRVQLASPELYARLAPSHRTGLHLLQIEGLRRYVRAPLPELFASAEAVLGRGTLRLGGKEVRALAAH
jgi:cytosine/adenosine deaminase-related metal-dependent hydrolase/ubiquinone/menaquinone biosynthesis C-methylase UbiE